MNAEDKIEQTGFFMACEEGNMKTAELIIQNSKDYDIDLNTQEKINFKTAFCAACVNEHKEMAELLIENSLDFNIDLNVKDTYLA